MEPYANASGSDFSGHAISLENSGQPGSIDQGTFDEIVQNIRQDRPASLPDFRKKFYGRTILNHTVLEGV